MATSIDRIARNLEQVQNQLKLVAADLSELSLAETLTDIHLYAVESSNLNAVGFDPTRNRLRVRFNTGSVYDYVGVPASEFTGLLGASSKGQYFNQEIKDSYSFVRVQ